MKPITRAVMAWALGSILALPVQAADPIRLGLVDELTGSQAEAGVLVMRGVQARNR